MQTNAVSCKVFIRTIVEREKIDLFCNYYICYSFHETKYCKNKFIYCAVYVMRKSKQTLFVKGNCYKLRDFVFYMNDIFVNLINYFVYVSVNIGYC